MKIIFFINLLLKKFSFFKRKVKLVDKIFIFLTFYLINLYIIIIFFFIKLKLGRFY